MLHCRMTCLVARSLLKVAKQHRHKNSTRAHHNNAMETHIIVDKHTPTGLKQRQHTQDSEKEEQQEKQA